MPNHTTPDLGSASMIQGLDADSKHYFLCSLLCSLHLPLPLPKVAPLLAPSLLSARDSSDSSSHPAGRPANSDLGAPLATGRKIANLFDLFSQEAKPGSGEWGVGMFPPFSRSSLLFRFFPDPPKDLHGCLPGVSCCTPSPHGS